MVESTTSYTASQFPTSTLMLESPAKPLDVFSVHGLTAAAALAFVLSGHELATAYDPGESLIVEKFSPLKIRRVIFPHVQDAYAEMASYAQLGDGWDGIGSRAPSGLAIADALSFLTALPVDVRSPEATASADSTVGWFWQTPRGIVTVNFQGNGRFAYYGRVAGTSARGLVVFDGASVPQDLLNVIRAA